MPRLKQLLKLKRLFAFRFRKRRSGIGASITLVSKIAEGRSRECWRHPHSGHLCIKVNKADRNRDQNKLDWHYARSLIRRKIESPHLPNYHGFAMTNRGRGLVMDLIADFDGTPSSTFLQAVRSGLFSREQITEIVERAFAWINSKIS